jgi:ribosomal protein S18 acetylase RimI-like enzyme
MSGAPHVVVSPLTEVLLQDVVRIHEAGLGYTVNSRLGKEHLAFLYRIMARDPTSYVGVAIVDRGAAGIISGTLDEDRLKSKLLRSMSAAKLTGVATGLLLKPSLMLRWLQSVAVAWPVRYEGKEIAAVLTALAVDPNIQRRGLGRRLVRTLELFFAANQVETYRLDTLATNQRALRFYQDLGFIEVARRAGSVVLVRRIDR